MRAILVDDESLPLTYLKKMLENEMEGVEVVGAYLDPLEACEAVTSLQPDVVFLDIHMPEMNGLEIGERIQENFSDVEIVFITGYDRYAVDAFDLYAIDYVMKPIRLERLKKTVERLNERLLHRKMMRLEIEQERQHISCFNTLKVELPDGTFEVMKWRTAKAQELFAYMLHYRGSFIHRDSLLELLWPDFDVSRREKLLYTTVFHIRQSLEMYGLEGISIKRDDLNDGYTFDIGSVSIDTEEWERDLKQLEPLEYDNMQIYERLVRTYTGDYFGAYDYLWAERERERLRRLWLNHAHRLSTYYIQNEMMPASFKVNQRIQQCFPVNEESHITS
ncbi:response regulator [Bacillus chungangensis]|uniref:Two-component SAPR family response regulator n=1 Tax=Bacillus chungangensis TaxID=587633 RepID=A0ABT9WTN0_9BACI|nr:response regulator [Bacillus chungangensis]MDQ0176579.1 two-component SAPR family response regulator [Bacillus chungangensis]